MVCSLGPLTSDRDSVPLVKIDARATEGKERWDLQLSWRCWHKDKADVWERDQKVQLVLV